MLPVYFTAPVGQMDFDMLNHIFPRRESHQHNALPILSPPHASLLTHSLAAPVSPSGPLTTIDLAGGLTEFFMAHSQAAAAVMGQQTGARPRSLAGKEQEIDPNVQAQNVLTAQNAVAFCLQHRDDLVAVLENAVTNEDMRNYLEHKGLAKYGSKRGLLNRMLSHWGVELPPETMQRQTHDGESAMSRRGRRENPTNEIAERILALAGNAHRPKDKVRALAQLLDPDSRLLESGGQGGARVTDEIFYASLMRLVPGISRTDVEQQVRHAMSTKPQNEEAPTISTFLQAFVRKEVKRQAEKVRNHRIADQKRSPSQPLPLGMDLIDPSRVEPLPSLVAYSVSLNAQPRLTALPSDIVLVSAPPAIDVSAALAVEGMAHPSMSLSGSRKRKADDDDGLALLDSPSKRAKKDPIHSMINMSMPMMKADPPTTMAWPNPPLHVTITHPQPHSLHGAPSGDDGGHTLTLLTQAQDHLMDTKK